VIRQNDESNTLCRETVKLVIQYLQQHPFRLIMVQQTPTSIAGKRHEVGIQGIINDSTLVPHP